MYFVISTIQIKTNMQTRSFESYRTQLTVHRKDSKNNTLLCSQNVNFFGNTVQQTRLKCLYYKKLFRVPVIFPLLRMRQELVQPVCVLIYVNFARILKLYLFDVICYTHVHLLWQLNLLSYSYLFLILQDFDVIRRPRNFSQQENVLRNNPQFHFSSFLFSIMCVFMCAV